MSIFNKPGGGNMFSNTNQNQNSLFSKPQQGTGLFSGQNTTSGTLPSIAGSIFNQGQTGQQGGTNLFSNQGGSTGLFSGGGNQGGTGLFSGNQGTSTNMFAPNTSTISGYNQPGTMIGAGGQFSQVNEAQMHHLLNAPEDQRKKLF